MKGLRDAAKMAAARGACDAERNCALFSAPYQQLTGRLEMSMKVTMLLTLVYPVWFSHPQCYAALEAGWPGNTVD